MGDIARLAKERAKEIQNSLSGRKEMFKGVEDIFFLDWSSGIKDQSIKETKSPDGRNALLGGPAALDGHRAALLGACRTQ